MKQEGWWRSSRSDVAAKNLAGRWGSDLFLALGAQIWFLYVFVFNAFGTFFGVGQLGDVFSPRQPPRRAAAGSRLVQLFDESALLGVELSDICS